MPSKKMVSCTCDAEGRLLRVSLDDLEQFQGELKTLHRDQYEKLRESIRRYGFFAPVFVWQGKILDGHQRLNVLREEGWTVEGGIPVVEIEAKDEREAAEKLLLLSSTYGKIEPQGLYEFIETAGLNLLEFDLPDLPDLDFDLFKAEFYEEETPGVEDFGETGKKREEYEAIVKGPAEKFTGIFLDELFKLVQKNGLRVEGDEPSRPPRHNWGSWTPGEVKKPEVA